MNAANNASTPNPEGPPASPFPPDFTPNPLFFERAERVKKAIALEEVDTVPVIFMGSAWVPRFTGVPMADYANNGKTHFDAQLAALKKLGDVDGINITGEVRFPVILTAQYMSKIMVPGKDFGPDEMWQVQEKEVMQADEYDTLIEQGWDQFFMNYLPRVIDPAEFGAGMKEMAEGGPGTAMRLMEAGYVNVSDGPAFVNHPFETLCGARSMPKFYRDLSKQPDKVQAAMDVLQAATLERIKHTPPTPGIRGAWLGGWRTASALLNPKLWDRFVWPYLVELVEAMVAVDLTPVLHWDQDWTRDLGRLTDLPAKKCIMNPDGMTDMKKFHEVAGDRMAMMGDVPAQLLAAGTPEQVRHYVKDRIDLFDGRGLIICPGCDAPVNSKEENIRAMIEAGREFGAR